MTSVERMMREQRLRYAIARETDRQNVTLSGTVIDALVQQAVARIDATCPSDEDRMFQSERAEKTLQPVIAALYVVSHETLGAEDVAQVMAEQGVAEFPWTQD